MRRLRAIAAKKSTEDSNVKGGILRLTPSSACLSEEAKARARELAQRDLANVASDHSGAEERINSDSFGASPASRILGNLTPPPRKENAVPFHPLTFRGLTLGMRIEDAHQRLEELLDEGLQGKARERVRLEHIKESSTYDIHFTLVDFSGQSYIQADENWRVRSFGLTPVVVEAIFNAGGMDPAAFGKRFIESYSIPSLEPVIDGTGWFYESKDGLRVLLRTDKGLIISHRKPAKFD